MIFDPRISEYKHKYGKYTGIESKVFDIVLKYDFIIITVSHSNVVHNMMNGNEKVIFDTKNTINEMVDIAKIDVIALFL